MPISPLSSNTRAPTVPKVLLWGGKSKARIIQQMLTESDLGEVTIIFDETLDALDFKPEGIFVNDVAQLKKHLGMVTHYVTCIGGEHGYARYKTSKFLENIGLKPITIIHPKSYVDETSVIGAGSQLMPFAVVHKFTEIGEHCILNTNCTVDHECKLGNGVHVMGNAAVAGKVEIADYATVGTNSTILPFIKIGEGAFVGAGAVVTRDVKPFAVVAGNPARKVRNNKFKFNETALKRLL